MRGPQPNPRLFPDDFSQAGRELVRRRTAAVCDVQRFRLVLLLHQHPDVRHDEAARIVGLSARQVQRWRQRWAGGDFSIEDEKGRGRKPTFSPLDCALVRAMACEVVAQTKRPISRQSIADLAKRAQEALNKNISRSSVWRILHEDAIEPWQYEHWIFPRDRAFSEKASPILDLYAGSGKGQPFGVSTHIIRKSRGESPDASLNLRPR